MEQIQTAVDELTREFSTFKANYETRMKKLENIDILLKRPSFDQGTENTSLEDHSYKNAFSAYLRKGDDYALQNMVTKALHTAENAEGGYLVPQIIEEKIMRRVEQASPLRRLASIMTISTSAVEVLIDRNTVAEAGWAAEADDRDETATPQLTKIRIPVHELYARPRATQKLLEDSMIDVESWLAARIAARMMQLENLAFLNGDGINKPKGILNYPTCHKHEWEWGKFEHIITGVAGGFAEENGADILIETVNALKAEYLKGSVWLMSRSAHATVKKLKDSHGHYLWQPSMNGEATPTLLGYPIEIAEEMPELIAGTPSKSIIFGNFKEAYQIVDRAGSSILRDPYSAKPYVEFYTVKRVGGDVVNFEALKIINCKAA
jgi:HK97 family phage major capsid protein